MPPHCDSLDGPVVTAARNALHNGAVEWVLPYVHADGEGELRDAFDLASKVRVLGPEAQVVADRWFFETAVRVHRAGEGADFAGLKPAGLDIGPVIPAAERALRSGAPDELVDLLGWTVRTQVEHRHERAMHSRHTHRRAWPSHAPTSRPCSACRCGPTRCTSRRWLTRTLISNGTSTAEQAKLSTRRSCHVGRGDPVVGFRGRAYAVIVALITLRPPVTGVMRLLADVPHTPSTTPLSDEEVIAPTVPIRAGGLRGRRRSG